MYYNTKYSNRNNYHGYVPVYISKINQNSRSNDFSKQCIYNWPGRDFRKTVNQRVSRKEATGVQLRIRVKIETL